MTAPVKFHSFISSHSHCFNTNINLVFLTASWRHPAGISIQSGFIRSETTSGGRSSELRVSDQSILNTQAVQTHWGQRNHNTRRRSDDDDGDEEVQDVWWSRITFLFTAVDNLQIFGDSWTGVLVHMSVCETKATIVTDLSNQREDAIYCAGSCRTWDEHEAVIRYQFSKYCSKLFHSTSWISQVRYRLFFVRRRQTGCLWHFPLDSEGQQMSPHTPVLSWNLHGKVHLWIYEVSTDMYGPTGGECQKVSVNL